MPARVTIASDNFNRANEDPLSDGGNWSALGDSAACRIVSNQATGPVLSQGFSLRSGQTFKSDQWSEITIGTTLSTNTIGPGLRMSSTNATLYYYDVFNVGSSMRKIVSGVVTTIGTTNNSYASGDVIRIEIIGNNLEAFKNNVSELSVTDSAINTSNPPGVMADTGGVDASEDWSGGNFITPGGNLLLLKIG